MTNPTQYYRPRSLNEALALAAQPGTLAMAGGALTFGHQVLPYASVVDLQDIADLKTVAVDETGLRIGAVLTLSALLDQPELPAALKSALTRTLSPNVLNGASVGESLRGRAHVLLQEWLAALVALGAAAETINPQHVAAHRERHMLITADQRLEEELITALLLPPMGPRTKLGTAHVARTPADAAIVCAAACVKFDEAGKVSSAMAALTGVSAAPVEGFALGALSGWPLNHETAQAAAEQIIWRIDPPDDYLGSADYRRSMAAVCLTRALEACAAQLESE
ncbi:MAG TPA: FAD binding domain-containing protein [Candidatus Limnocylindrales bacterium]|nr:FAD binding domain-containing protein [Candidatus Limnocylindrales bacterium]